MRSTASADTKQPFGGKPARFSLLSMLWIAVNHRREVGVFRADDASTDGFENQRLPRSPGRPPSIAHGQRASAPLRLGQKLRPLIPAY